MNIVDIAFSRGNSRKISVVYSSNKGNYSEEKVFELPFLLVKPTISKNDLEKTIYEYRGESKKPDSVVMVTKIFEGIETSMFKVYTSVPSEIPALRKKLLSQGLEVFESDIPYRFRVGLDNKLNYYDKTMPRILAFDIETKREIPLEKHHETYFPPRIAFVHHECHFAIHHKGLRSDLIKYSESDGKKFYDQQKQLSKENTWGVSV